MPLWGKYVADVGGTKNPDGTYELSDALETMKANAVDEVRLGEPMWYARRTIVDLSAEGVLDGNILDLSKASTCFAKGDWLIFIPMSDLTQVGSPIQVVDVQPSCKHELASPPSAEGEVMIVKVHGHLHDDADGEIAKPDHYDVKDNVLPKVTQPFDGVVWAVLPITKEMILADQADEEHPLAKVGIVSCGWYRFAMCEGADGVLMVRAELLVGIKEFSSELPPFDEDKEDPAP